MEVAQLLNTTEANPETEFLQSTIFFAERRTETPITSINETTPVQTPTRWITLEEAEAATILFCFDTLMITPKTPTSPSSIRNANSCKYHRKRHQKCPQDCPHRKRKSIRKRKH